MKKKKAASSAPVAKAPKSAESAKKTAMKEMKKEEKQMKKQDSAKQMEAPKKELDVGEPVAGTAAAVVAAVTEAEDKPKEVLSARAKKGRRISVATMGGGALSANQYMKEMEKKKREEAEAKKAEDEARKAGA